MRTITSIEYPTKFSKGHTVGLAFDKFHSDYEISGIQITAEYVKGICSKHLSNSSSKNQWALVTGRPFIIENVKYRYFITFDNERTLTSILLRL